MANRWFNQFKGSLERGIVQLDGYVQIHTDATVLADTILGASVAKTGTGEYTITLEDSYPKLLHVGLTPTSQGTNANQVWKLKQAKDADGVDCGASLLNVKTLIVSSCASNGAPTDVSVACGVTVHLVLKNSVS
jgi:hypothetical protein